MPLLPSLLLLVLYVLLLLLLLVMICLHDSAPKIAYLRRLVGEAKAFQLYKPPLPVTVLHEVAYYFRGGYIDVFSLVYTPR
jgi:hypothetical protein